jgi:hypothetical protein
MDDATPVSARIVERLRSPQFADVAEKYLMVEAADEIERLRAENIDWSRQNLQNVRNDVNRDVNKAMADEIERRAVRWAQEQIAAAVEQSAFYYAGTGATKVVPSASGEMTTHVMAAYIRSLDLDERRLTGRNTDHEQATTRDRNDDRDRPGYCDGNSRR